MLTYTRYIMLVPKGGLEPPTFWLWFRRSKPTELRRDKDLTGEHANTAQLRGGAILYGGWNWTKLSLAYVDLFKQWSWL